VLIGGAACLGLALFAYAPFWAGAETLRNVGDRRTLYNVSWLSALRYALDPTLGGDQAQNVAAMCSLVLLLAGIGWATWRAWRAPDEVSAHMLWLALWFMFVANPWFQPWYLVWVVALAAVQPMRHHIQVAVGLFCATALASYIVGGLVLPALGLSQPMLVRELLVSLFVYLPPLLVLAWAARRPARAPAYDHMDQVVPIMSNTSGGKVS
jgi:alpha-1,6-mannosyltransferase